MIYLLYEISYLDVPLLDGGLLDLYTILIYNILSPKSGRLNFLMLLPKHALRRINCIILMMLYICKIIYICAITNHEL